MTRQTLSTVARVVVVIPLFFAIQCFAQGPEYAPPFSLSPVEVHLTVHQWQPFQVLDAYGRSYTPENGWWADPTLKIADEAVISFAASDCGTCDWGQNILLEARKPGSTTISVVVSGETLTATVTVHSGDSIPPGTDRCKIKALLTDGTFPSSIDIGRGDEWGGDHVTEERGREGAILRGFGGGSNRCIERWVWPDPWDPAVTPRLVGRIPAAQSGAEDDWNVLAQLTEHGVPYTVAIDGGGKELWRRQMPPWEQLGYPKFNTFAVLEEDSQRKVIAIHDTDTGEQVGEFVLPTSRRVHAKATPNAHAGSGCDLQVVDSETSLATVGWMRSVLPLAIFLPLTTSETTVQDGDCGSAVSATRIRRTVELRLLVWEYNGPPKLQTIQQYSYDGSNPNAVMDWVEPWGGAAVSSDEELYIVARKSKVTVGDSKYLSSRGVIYRIDNSEKPIKVLELSLTLPLSAQRDDGAVRIGYGDTVIYSNGDAFQVIDWHSGKVKWTYHSPESFDLVGGLKNGDVVIQTDPERYWRIHPDGRRTYLPRPPKFGEDAMIELPE